LGILEWAHRRETPAQRRTWALLRKAAKLNFPVVPGLHHLLLAERRFRRGPLRLLWSKIYDEPLLRLQCDSVGEGLMLNGAMPKVLGNLRVTLGARVRLEAAQVWTAAGPGTAKTLEIGDDTGIGYATELVSGESIRIGRHVMISNRVLLAGYDGHPMDPFARARHDPPGKEGSAAITIEDYAWIGADATIMKGVTIGRGAIVAMGSMVKVSVPELTVVSGNPAKVVWRIEPPQGW
jgi:acetyltransferase-like isoleucine patch superfamily enzyme